jgi:hypothetical protein
MKLLVIGSCTGDKKNNGCPESEYLTEADFDTVEKMRAGESRLSQWILPATDLYIGEQHLRMARGIAHLRRHFGHSACVLKIISAGYGVVEEDRSLAPYEVSFSNKPCKWIRDRAAKLDIPAAVRSAIRGYEAVVFLLGNKYLLSIDPPLTPHDGQCLIFLTTESESKFDSRSILISAGMHETKRFGAGFISLKGKMFECFATGLCAHPEKWENLLASRSPQVFEHFMESGRDPHE